ncbi:NadS family protein, partial [Escherichia coli]|uniref:NadS family protein n=1 Tax=Escherichia coli TaxID=562 RepID=UPI003EDF983C
ADVRAIRENLNITQSEMAKVLGTSLDTIKSWETGRRNPTGLASTGSTGDSYDNAMAESINGLYKAEVIHRKSWKNRAEVELA